MTEYFAGLMSGTSCDGIDAVLVDFAGGQARTCATYLLPYDDALKRRLFAAAAGEHDSLDTVARLDTEIGELSAQAVLALLGEADVAVQEVRAIGSHGHTLRHRPQGEPPFTVQIGDAQRLAKRTGIITVADFRRGDIAVGGQGAPLAPAFHAAFLRDRTETRAVLNLGGMANLTVLPPAPARVLGFDTGPGNALMDDWSRAQRAAHFDRDGDWAASGKVDAALLEALLGDEYFARPPPKSTGREHFDLDWARACQSGAVPAGADFQATLCELTARTVADALRHYAPEAARVLLCGGGTHNRHLLARLRHHLPCPLGSTAEFGVEPDWLEAVAFAWLAKCALDGKPGNLAAVTGASREVVLGAIHAF